MSVTYLKYDDYLSQNFAPGPCKKKRISGTSGYYTEIPLYYMDHELVIQGCELSTENGIIEDYGIYFVGSDTQHEFFQVLHQIYIDCANKAINPIKNEIQLYGFNPLYPQETGFRYLVQIHENHPMVYLKLSKRTTFIDNLGNTIPLSRLRGNNFTCIPYIKIKKIEIGPHHGPIHLCMHLIHAKIISINIPFEQSMIIQNLKLVVPDQVYDLIYNYTQYMTKKPERRKTYNSFYIPWWPSYFYKRNMGYCPYY